MAYATAQAAIQDGSIIYGRGNVTAKRTDNGFIYWPTKGGAAMDSASAVKSNVVDDFSPEVKRKIARAKRKVAMDKEDNEIADAMVAMLFPSLQAAMANDDAMLEAVANGIDGEEEEQEVQGTFSSSEAEDEGISFEESVIASAKNSADHWNKVKAAQAQRRKSSGRYQPVSAGVRTQAKKAQAADAMSVNARRSRPYSLFQSAASIIKRQKKSA